VDKALQLRSMAAITAVAVCNLSAVQSIERPYLSQLCVKPNYFCGANAYCIPQQPIQKRLRFHYTFIIPYILGDKLAQGMPEEAAQGCIYANQVNYSQGVLYVVVQAIACYIPFVAEYYPGPGRFPSSVTA
jgi:hypothetical protein